MASAEPSNGPDGNGSTPEGPRDGSDKKALRAQLEHLMATRVEAASLREGAQEVSEQGKAIREGARRIRDSARRAQDRLPAISYSGWAPPETRAREADETEVVQAALQEANHEDAWERADRARLVASRECLQALTISREKADRELAEARSLYAAAKSFRASAQRELKSTRAMIGELFLDGHEVEELREATAEEPPLPSQPADLSDPNIQDDIWVPLDVTDAERPSYAEAEPSPDSRSADSHTEDVPLPETSATQDERDPEADDGSPAPDQIPFPPTSPRISDPDLERLERSLNSSKRWDNLVEKLVQETCPASPEPVDLTRRSLGVNERSEGDPPSRVAQDVTEESLKEDLAELRRSLEGLRSSEEAPKLPSVSGPRFPEPEEEDRSPPSSILESPLEALETLLSHDTPPPEAAEEIAPSELPHPVSEEIPWASPSGPVDLDVPDVPPASSPAPSMPLPTTCSGRLTLVFTPCPDAENLGLFWENLEKMAGASAIVDAAPLEEGAGFAFTLELGDGVLAVEELKRLIPHTQMMAVGENTLSINWSSRRPLP